MRLPALSLLILISLFSISVFGCNSDDSTPVPTDTDGGNELNLTVGEKWRYEFSVHGEQYGFNEYEVISESSLNDEKTFTIKSTLELQESDACQPTTASGTYQVTATVRPVSYHMDISVGSG